MVDYTVDHSNGIAYIGRLLRSPPQRDALKKSSQPSDLCLELNYVAARGLVKDLTSA